MWLGLSSELKAWTEHNGWFSLRRREVQKDFNFFNQFFLPSDLNWNTGSSLVSYDQLLNWNHTTGFSGSQAFWLRMDYITSFAGLHLVNSPCWCENSLSLYGHVSQPLKINLFVYIYIYTHSIGSVFLKNSDRDSLISCNPRAKQLLLTFSQLGGPWISVTLKYLPTLTSLINAHYLCWDCLTSMWVAFAYREITRHRFL